MINTVFLGKVLKHFSELPSTNDYARILLSKSKPAEGMVIIADNQTAGRGQYGSSWENEPSKALLLSVILYPKFLTASRQFQLSRAVALGVQAFCAACTEDSYFIKWPNDIYKNSKKCAGILIENSLQGSHIESSIVGIGINLAPLPSHKHLTDATGIYEHGEDFDIDLLVGKLLQHLEYFYLQLMQQDKDADIAQQYHRQLFRRNQNCSFELPNGTQITGKIEGTDEYGRLMVQSDGQLLSFATKEIRMIL